MEANLIPLWAAVVPAVVAAMVFAFIAVRLTLEFREKRQLAAHRAGGPAETSPEALAAAVPADIGQVRARLDAFARDTTSPGDPAARQMLARADDWLRGCEGADPESAWIAACGERFRGAELVLDDALLDPPQKMKKLLRLFEPQEPV